MTTRRLSNEFMEEMLNDAAWEDLAADFAWTEQLLEKYEDKLNWEKISDNVNILWTQSMLDKFRNRIDWNALSSNSNKLLFTKANLIRFKNYWNWSELSSNNFFKPSPDILEELKDMFNWGELINRYFEDELYSFDFLEQVIDKIPLSQLQTSQLWSSIVNSRTKELTIEILS